MKTKISTLLFKQLFFSFMLFAKLYLLKHLNIKFRIFLEFIFKHFF